FMEKATGVPYDEYSVTIPPFQTGNPRIDNRQSNPDPVLLGYLNVKYVVSEFWISDLDFTLVDNDRGTFIYENEKYLPRAVVYRSESRSGDYRTAQIVDYTPNRIYLATEGSGLLVLSEINYPGWIVTIDGDPASIVTVDGLFRAVELPEGNHLVEFIFHPMSVYTGIGISLVSLVIILGILLITHRHGSDT
ncbi:MAG: YfhO family protein, partial [Aliifodinibius sp.]|nr:YfhO family protein [Fodinibius sp.]NIV15189.1 YfhO family protein [Fodinibius sp.]NIY29036.1 YfhO family protein [Fodinibius sp.]